jgi:hypothetical protein
LCLSPLDVSFSDLEILFTLRFPLEHGIDSRFLTLLRVSQRVRNFEKEDGSIGIADCQGIALDTDTREGSIADLMAVGDLVLVVANVPDILPIY